MQPTLLVLLTLIIPAVTAPLMLLIRRPLLRKVIVSVISCAMIAVAVALGISVLTQGHIIIDEAMYRWVSPVVAIIDGVTLAVILYFGIRLRQWKIIAPSLTAMLPGCSLADVPVIILSIDPCISCTDR